MSECSYVKPFVACLPDNLIFFSVISKGALAQTGFIRFGARADARLVIDLPIVCLNKNIMPRLQQPISDLSFDTDIRDLAESGIIRARAVSIERIAVRIGVLDLKDECEVDFVVQRQHGKGPFRFINPSAFHSLWQRAYADPVARSGNQAGIRPKEDHHP